MSGSETEEALAHYLTQPGATADVCDPATPGPHVIAPTQDGLDAITKGLTSGHIPPPIWQQCATTLLATEPPATSARFLEALVRAYRAKLRSSRIQEDAVQQGELAALHAVLLNRAAGTSPRATEVASAIDDLRTALAKKRLGPVAARFGEEMLATLEIEQGEWRGQPVTVATLDRAEREKDEALLHRFSLRLADATLRLEARERIVRLQVAASAWPEVRDHAEEVLARVTAQGRNAVDLREHHADAATLPVLSLAAILVRQDLLKQTAKLVTRDSSPEGASLLPPFDLRGRFQVRLDGLSQPVSVCAPPELLDVTPCISPADVRVESSAAFVDGRGALRVREHMPLADAIAFAHDQSALVLPIDVGGKRVSTLGWPLHFEKPENLLFDGGAGAPGPNLVVAIEEHDPARLFFRIDNGAGPIVGAIERADAPAFLIASRGGDGAAGWAGNNGMDGTSGTSGFSASCPSSNGSDGSDGSNGTDGGNGSDGGDGGPGGDVRVQLTCIASDCANAAALVRSMVQSRGGNGGSGGAAGRGGRGGSGGSGGSGTSCTDSDGHSYSLSGGSSGRAGSDGNDGWRGRDGAAGPAGEVVVVVHPTEASRRGSAERL